MLLVFDFESRESEYVLDSLVEAPNGWPESARKCLIRGPKKRKKLTLDSSSLFVVCSYNLFGYFFVSSVLMKVFFVWLLGKEGGGGGSLSEAKKSDQNNLSFASGIK
jgi:hypothetical protein